MILGAATGNSPHDESKPEKVSAKEIDPALVVLRPIGLRIKELNSKLILLRSINDRLKLLEKINTKVPPLGKELHDMEGTWIDDAVKAVAK